MFAIGAYYVVHYPSFAILSLHRFRDSSTTLLTASVCCRASTSRHDDHAWPLNKLLRRVSPTYWKRRSRSSDISIYGSLRGTHQHTCFYPCLFVEYYRKAVLVVWDYLPCISNDSTTGDGDASPRVTLLFWLP